jgi:hypothetical protein
VKPAISHYLIRFVIFLAVVAGLLYAYQHFNPAEALPIAWGLLGFFAVASFGAHLFLLNAEDKRPAVFVRRFMGTTTVRLFVFIIILAGYSFTHVPQAVSFILHFLVFYLVFTAFEITMLYRHFRPKN